jgi:hypothetical protein
MPSKSTQNWNENFKSINKKNLLFIYSRLFWQTYIFFKNNFRKLDHLKT